MKAQIPLLVLMVALLSGVLPSSGAELVFRTLAQGNYSGIGRATNLVITTKTEWERLWKLHQAAGEPLADVPAVDFAKEMVVAAAMAQKPTGGYAIEIKRIEATPTQLRISLAQKAPGPDAIVTQAFSAPFHFVAVPKVDLKPKFVIQDSELSPLRPSFPRDSVKGSSYHLPEP